MPDVGQDELGQVRARKSLKCDVTVFLICVLIFVLKGSWIT